MPNTEIENFHPEFISFGEALLSDDEARELAQTLLGGVGHTPRGWFESFLAWLRSMLAYLGISKNILRIIHPSAAPSERFRDIQKRLKQYVIEGHAAIAKVNERAVSFYSAHASAVTPEGRTQYIFTGMTLPQFQHHGLNSALRKMVIEHLEKSDKNAIYLAGTKNPIVIARCRKEEWQEIGYERYRRDRGEQIPRKELRICLADGWTGFAYDPTLQGPLSRKITTSK